MWSNIYVWSWKNTSGAFNVQIRANFTEYHNIPLISNNRVITKLTSDGIYLGKYDINDGYISNKSNYYIFKFDSDSKENNNQYRNLNGPSSDTLKGSFVKVTWNSTKHVATYNGIDYIYFNGMWVHGTLNGNSFVAHLAKFKGDGSSWAKDDQTFTWSNNKWNAPYNNWAH